MKTLKVYVIKYKIDGYINNVTEFHTTAYNKQEAKYDFYYICGMALSKKQIPFSNIHILSIKEYV